MTEGTAARKRAQIVWWRDPEFSSATLVETLEADRSTKKSQITLEERELQKALDESPREEKERWNNQQTISIDVPCRASIRQSDLRQSRRRRRNAADRFKCRALPA
jgi:hypothetical protein